LQAHIHLPTLGRIQRAEHVLAGQSVNVILFSHGPIPGQTITLLDTDGTGQSFKRNPTKALLRMCGCTGRLYGRDLFVVTD
jgi:hypothetical protein